MPEGTPNYQCRQQLVAHKCTTQVDKTQTNPSTEGDKPWEKTRQPKQLPQRTQTAKQSNLHRAQRTKQHITPQPHDHRQRQKTTKKSTGSAEHLKKTTSGEIAKPEKLSQPDTAAPSQRMANIHGTDSTLARWRDGSESATPLGGGFNRTVGGMAQEKSYLSSINQGMEKLATAQVLEM
jgi:hypothetical protein